MPKEGEIAARLISGGLTLAFVWRGDRFVHTITAGGAALASAEQGGVETPVYQEVHQQGELVFASGMSGDRHWSASVEPRDGGLLFDIACRAKTRAEGLGVVYEGPADTIQLVTDPEDAAAPTGLSAIHSAQVVASTAEPGDPPVTVRMRYRAIV